jgi:hypothetical protein
MISMRYRCSVLGRMVGNGFQIASRSKRWRSVAHQGAALRPAHRDTIISNIRQRSSLIESYSGLSSSFIDNEQIHHAGSTGSTFENRTPINGCVLGEVQVR